MNEPAYKEYEKYHEPNRPHFHEKLYELAKSDPTVPLTVRYPGDPLRLVIRHQLVLQLKQPSLINDDEVILSGLNVESKQFIRGVKAIVRRVSHCNPSLVLLEGDGIQFLTPPIEVEYSPGRDVPPPEVSSSSANDVHYSPGRDVPPPDGFVTSSGAGGTPVVSRSVSFDSQLRRILAGSVGWREYPIVAVMDTGIDFAFPNTATIPIQHNGGHPMCDTVEPDYIGWDFVNDQNDPYDDDRQNKHGSRIAAIISKAMDNRVRILPLKVIGNSGVGTLFDIFCGFEYILSSRLPEKPKVVNASWGFYSIEENALLTTYILRLRNQFIWLVNAAGNRGDINPDGSNVSLNEKIRYPACYSNLHFNVLTGTTTKENPFDAVENYSSLFVNSGVQGDQNGGFPESLDTNPGNPKIIGSSYATPYASAFVALNYREPSDRETRQVLVQGFPNSSEEIDLFEEIENGMITVPLVTSM